VGSRRHPHHHHRHQRHGGEAGAGLGAHRRWVCALDELSVQNRARSGKQCQIGLCRILNVFDVPACGRAAVLHGRGAPDALRRARRAPGRAGRVHGGADAHHGGRSERRQGASVHTALTLLAMHSLIGAAAIGLPTPWPEVCGNSGDRTVCRWSRWESLVSTMTGASRSLLSTPMHA